MTSLGSWAQGLVAGSLCQQDRVKLGRSGQLWEVVSSNFVLGYRPMPSFLSSRVTAPVFGAPDVLSVTRLSVRSGNPASVRVELQPQPTLSWQICGSRASLPVSSTLRALRLGWKCPALPWAWEAVLARDSAQLSEALGAQSQAAEVSVLKFLVQGFVGEQG